MFIGLVNVGLPSITVGRIDNDLYSVITIVTEFLFHCHDLHLRNPTSVPCVCGHRDGCAHCVC